MISGVYFYEVPVSMVPLILYHTHGRISYKITLDRMLNMLYYNNKFEAG